MTKGRAKSLAEPCLLSGIGGDLILGITSKAVELSHILMNGHLSLIQIAELFLLALHQLIQNVVPSKGNTELLPSHYVTIWLHCNIVLPPLKSSTFQEVYRKDNSIIRRNMCSIKLTLDGTEPIISFKGLRRTSEYRWLEEDEVLNADHHITMMGGILLDELQKACLITSIPLGFHHDFRCRRRWWSDGDQPRHIHGQGPWVSHRKHRLDDKLVGKQEDTFLLDILMMEVRLQWIS